jgi:hypothetical protein
MLYSWGILGGSERIIEMLLRDSLSFPNVEKLRTGPIR